MSDNGSKGALLGEILVKEGVINEAQLKDLVAKQKAARPYLPFGQICIRENILSQHELNRILRVYHKRIRLGELLLNMQILTPAQLEQALAQQKTKRHPLGHILIDMGFINDHTLCDALSLQLGIPKIMPSIHLIDKKLLGKFNPDFLLKHNFIPAFKEREELTVIMADPLHDETIDFLRHVLKSRIVPAIAPASEISKTIRLYHQKIELGQDLESPFEVKDLIIGEELPTHDRDNIVEMVNYIVSDAIRDRATDIHIEPQERFLRIRYRIDGMMHHRTDLPNHVAAKFVSRIKAICGLDIAEKRRHQDGRIQARVMSKEYDLRVSTYAVIWGENIVIRIQSRQSAIIDINKIGFSPVNLKKYMRMLDHPSGVILVTGPTGCGKSTTLYASMQYLNKSDRVIVTVEDPVEYTIDGVVQASIPAKLRTSYMDYIRAMMRQDPDVLMIGEIRDPQAAEGVIQASLTGHKVLSTFHTEDSVGALLRLMDMGIETFLISSTLVSVVAQRLVRLLCPHCKAPHPPATEICSFFNSLKQNDLGDYTFYRAKGCMHCSHTGYRGMTALHEVLLVNDAIRNAILKRSTSRVIKRIARKHAGLVTLSEDGFFKALSGITTLEDVIRVVFRDESEGIEPISIKELLERCRGVQQEPTDLATV